VLQDSSEAGETVKRFNIHSVECMLSTNKEATQAFFADSRISFGGFNIPP
jgi:predicted metal-binding protein